MQKGYAKLKLPLHEPVVPCRHSRPSSATLEEKKKKKSLTQCMHEMHEHHFLNRDYTYLWQVSSLGLSFETGWGIFCVTYVCEFTVRLVWHQIPDHPILVLQLNSWILIQLTQQEIYYVHAHELNHSEFMEEADSSNYTFSLDRLPSGYWVTKCTLYPDPLKNVFP